MFATDEQTENKAQAKKEKLIAMSRNRTYISSDPCKDSHTTPPVRVDLQPGVLSLVFAS